MKKTILALAALSVVGVASAQSTVTLTGNFKAGVTATRVNAVPGAGSARGLGLADGSSRFIIGITEDLGGGLFAIAQADTRFRVDDNGGIGAAPTAAVASQLAGGNTFIGLRGGFGTIQMGKLDTHYCLGSDTHGVRATALQASSCALLGYMNGAGATDAIAVASRSTNMIRYTTPSMGGFFAELNYSPSWGGAEGLLTADKGDARSLKLGFAAGPVNVQASLWSAKNEPESAAQSAQTVAANFNFGVGTVGVTYDQSKTRAIPGVWNKRTVVSVPVTFRMGNATLLGTYSKAGDVKNTATVQNTGATLLSVGVDYALSRRTSFGVSYAAIKNESAAGYNLYTQAALGGHGAGTTGYSIARGQDPNQLYVGLRHGF